ncbi:hypothetical protein C4K18_2301 [Pseudomonas chlororaphis subsp. aurantiaca]|nr:hypothetical protein C4K18_2301 [Pseudomonas chlororaphis subsp. aurantiaca]
MSTPSQPLPIVVLADQSCVASEFEIETGHRYRFLVEGLWADAKDPPTGPEGVAHPGGIREGFGWARRLPEAAWMALLVRTEGPTGKSPWRLLGAASRSGRTCYRGACSSAPMTCSASTGTTRGRWTSG